MRVHETEVVAQGEIREGQGADRSLDIYDWRERLRGTIADRKSPVNLVGVGNELRRDDGVGLEVVSSLRSKLGGSPVPGVRIHGGAPMPERLLARLASHAGRIVVFDAVEASGLPGDVVFCPMSDTKYGFFGTHNIPLRLIPGLTERLGDVFLVGVQPANLEVGLGLSPKVRESVAELVAVVAEGVRERA